MNRKERINNRVSKCYVDSENREETLTVLKYQVVRLVSKTWSKRNEACLIKI